MLKCYISGYYTATNGENVDYNNVEVNVPDCDEKKLTANIINRVVARVFANAKKPYGSRGKCYVDKVVKDGKMKPSFEGKNIKDLDWNDIEDLAIAYDLAEVPLFRQCAERSAREIAYREYCNKVKGMHLEAGFNYGVAEDFVLGEPKKASKKADSEGNLSFE